MSLAKNVEFLRQVSQLNHLNGFGIYGRSAPPAASSPLVRVKEFGDNPGALKMYSHVPENLPRKPALVVVLHGCGQTAAGYDVGTGWSALSDRYGFALLMPEQRAANNPNTCFNWFGPDDAARDSGEAASIRQMIATMVADHRVDPRRIFITGLSAGGAMSAVMLATYPELFAAGAVIAGLPFGVAGNVREALGNMMQGGSRPARALGDLVRGASQHRGPWPKLSVWHGGADRTVHPSNAGEIVKQWADLHGLEQAPMSETVVDGHPRQVWWNDDGETVIESYTITDMAHGTPLSLAGVDEPYGAEGAYLIEAGIASSYHIANFFGLTGRVRQKTNTEGAPKPAKPYPAVAPVTLRGPDLSATLWSRQAEPHREAPRTPRSGIAGIGDVINRALTAAGLKK